MRERIAIITPGGIGAGYFSQGYPPLLNFVQKLSDNYDITVYSIHPVNPDFLPGNFKLRSIAANIKSSKVRIILLSILFMVDHMNNSYKLIHAFWVYPAGTMSVILGRLVKRPSIVTVQGGEAAMLPEIGYGNMINPMVRKLTLWTCENATCLNSISDFLISELHKYGLKRTDVVVIPFGPERTIFKKVKKNRSSILRIIHVANLTEVKDQTTLINSFALIVKHRPAELRIIGGDFMGRRLQRLVNDMNLNNHVSFLGAIPNKELTEHYQWADIMVHTSLHEGQSGVVMEAMASGVVVCGTRVGILYDLGEKYFVTVDVGDYETLATKVIQLEKDTRSYSSLQENCFRWIEKYDASWTVKSFGTLYSTVMRNNKMK